MPVKIDTNIIAFLLVVIVLFGIAMALRIKTGGVFKLIFKLVIGGVFLLLFNIAGKFVNIELPLNPLTAFFAGIFQIPGIAFLLIVKYVIYT